MIGAWFYFLAFNLRRQLRARLMVWISLALFGVVALVTHLNTRYDRWNLAHWRMTVRLPHRDPRAIMISSRVTNEPDPQRMTAAEMLIAFETLGQLPLRADGFAGPTAFAASLRAVIFEAGPRLFSSAIIFSLLTSLLLPIWTLTFGTESLGRAIENRTLTWLLLRPLPRPGIYIAAYLSALPWCLVLTLGGYFLFCALGGPSGQRVLPLYWPPLLLGVFAFTAFYQLLSVVFRRSGILGLLYAFFFETIASNLPGQQKRLSISYYVRCWMHERAQDAGLNVDLSGIRPPVSGTTACVVLVIATLLLLIAGVVVFSRKEYAN